MSQGRQLSPNARAGLIRALEAIVGPGGVIAKPEELAVYECDGLTYLRKAAPDLAVLPTTTEQVSQVVRLCAAEGVPFVPRGAGTGLSGGAIPAEGGILIGLNRMTQIRRVDLENRFAVAEAGVVNLRLTEAVVDRGYFFAPDPASQKASTIGGNAANNAGGPHCLKYGSTVNHVLGLEVVLPDGEVVHLGAPTADPPGYDLTGLFVGSEGTFGIATAITVRLVRQPEALKTVLAIFKSIDDASAAVSGIIGRGIIPAAMEMMDHLIIQAVEAAVHAGYPLDAGAVLLIELDGPRAEIETQTAGILAVCQAHDVLDIRVAKTDEERALLWKGRKEAAGAVGRITHEYYLQDAVVPRTKLPQILREIDGIAARHGVAVANVFHAGDGNLHPLICFDSRRPGELDRALAAGAEILKLCIAAGGSITGEHGVGLEKMDFMPLMFSPEDLNAMTQVRAAFNPRNLCNPGKILPTAKSCVEVGGGKLDIAYRPHRIEREGLAQRL